ncbi:rod shape-determining protein MreC [Polaribacter reichenbachii]|uniref:Cell shape-determining protein MreC n=1 Tax=Polaribacter reichenbachii TaxID=996801 RepID=A0A1B8TVH1_9FLAO|nr:rod shape-determining protein MreC [Polaribacter reichenbachii]APZ45216.1 rod shape-determining protein MreC [Polaribacter reichenbachii]AUC19079.1 rod shape-determining protein MreC [Polaribacter reichenbachii]OBY63766.1 rod shape-determining protein MreC [Polaribacter reichenbachii]
MQQIIFFLQKFKNFLFFLLLALISLALTFNNLNFHKSKFVNSANSVTGGLYSKASNISEYWSLKSENKSLAEENTRLKNLLEKNSSVIYNSDSTVVDSVKYHQKYTYTTAKIINNNYSKAFNFLTINKGETQGITKEMAVVNSKGIIGITDNTSNGYARVQSILNRNSKINARLKNSSYFGTLSWNGVEYNTVQLSDIPRQAPLKIGDTIETGGKSTIFPEGILIGTISKVNKGNTADNKVDVLLFNDMSNLGYVQIIKNLDKQEIKNLETQNE